MSRSKLNEADKRLQIKKGDDWEWVFSMTNGKVVTTPNKKKALKPRDLEIFQKKFGNDEFRVSERKTSKAKEFLSILEDRAVSHEEDKVSRLKSAIKSVEIMSQMLDPKMRKGADLLVANLSQINLQRPAERALSQAKKEIDSYLQSLEKELKDAEKKLSSR